VLRSVGLFRGEEDMTMAEPTRPQADGIVTKASPRSVGETVSRLTGLIRARGLMLFSVVDHSGEAEKAGLHMPDTKLVLFGSPAAGTPVMLAAPSAAIDLPLKILVAADDGGGVSVSYNTGGYLASRHHLTEELCSRLDVIEAISDALVSP
jgi:uncharacterized protein (DUF302 family)